MAITVAFVTVALGAPPASADTCVITVTVAGGQQMQFTVNVPPGTPISSIPLPVHVPVVGESESCTAPPPTTTTAPPPTTSTTSTTSKTSTSTPPPTTTTTSSR